MDANLYLESGLRKEKNLHVWEKEEISTSNEIIFKGKLEHKLIWENMDEEFKH